MRRKVAYLIAGILAIGLVSPVFAQDSTVTDAIRESGEIDRFEPGLSEASTLPESGGGDAMGEIDAWLQRASATLDDNLLFGKIRFTPFISQQFIYDDNIFLNDTDEDDTEGRVWDFISDTRINLEMVMPVNKEYSRFFDRDRVTLLGYEVEFLEYSHRGDTDAINQRFWTDLFAFFNDLTEIGVEGNHFYVEAGAEWSRVTDPLNIILRDLDLPGFPPVNSYKNLTRDAIEANALIGYKGNALDAFVGFEYYWLDFKDSVFEQANLDSYTGLAEVGYTIPNMADKRVYARFRYTDLNMREDITAVIPGSSPKTIATQPILNDADVYNITLGFEGTLISKKMRFVLEAGYEDWDADDSGFTGDDNDYEGGTGLVRVMYKPWAEKSTTFQVEGARFITWSAISNYRVNNEISGSWFEEWIPKKLRSDVTISWGHYLPSDGPTRSLFTAGAGLTYDLTSQVDVWLRYVYRAQTSENELIITGANADGSLVTLETDGDFFQNVVSVGLSVIF